MAHPAVPLGGPSEMHRRQLAEASNRILQGQVNWTLAVTLVVSSATTTVADSRLGASSAVLACPLTADAAAEIGNGTMWFVPTVGSLTINHANNTQADRSFMLVFLG